MINAGAILVCALLKTLVKPDMTLAEKFDFTMNYFEVSIYNYCILIVINIFRANYILAISGR